MVDPAVDLSVIVVAHNGRELVIKTLESARLAADASRTEWILVDSGSVDGTADAVTERFQDVTVIRESNIGFAAGNNRGIARARGRYLLLLNPDTEILQGSLGDLVRALDE